MAWWLVVPMKIVGIIAASMALGLTAGAIASVAHDRKVISSSRQAKVIDKYMVPLGMVGTSSLGMYMAPGFDPQAKPGELPVLRLAVTENVVRWELDKRIEETRVIEFTRCVEQDVYDRAVVGGYIVNPRYRPEGNEVTAHSIGN